MEPSKTTTNTELNGIHLEPLGETVETIQGNPELAKRLPNHKQVDLGRQEQHNGLELLKCGEEKPALTRLSDQCGRAARNWRRRHEPKSVEHLLNALAGCITMTLVAHAAIRGIEIEEFESRLESDLDLTSA